MATTTIREFLVGVGFDVDEAGLSKFSAAITKASTVALALGAAAIAGAAAVVGAVRGIAEEYDKLDKLAARFRSTTEAVDEFSDIAGVLGLADGVAVGGLTALDRAIGDTALGLGRAKKVFEEIGLQVLDSAGKMRSTTVVMEELGAKLSQMERGKAIAVMERLGLDPSLLKIFNADLTQLRADLEAIDKAAGFDLSEAVEQSSRFMRGWRALSQEFAKVRLVFSKMYEAVAVKLMPQLTIAVDEVRRRVEAARKFIMENMAGIREALSGVVGFLLGTFSAAWQLAGRVLDLVIDYVMLVINAFKQLDPTLQAAILTVAGLAAAWRLLNLSFLASPITWLLLLGAALVALYDDYLVWKEGGESLIDWGQWKSEIDFVTGIVAGFKDMLTNAFTLIYAAVDALASLLRGDFAGAWRAVGEGVDAVVGIFKTAFEWVTKLIDGVAKLGGFSGSITSAIGSGLQSAVAATSGGLGTMAADPSGAGTILGANAAPPTAVLGAGPAMGQGGISQTVNTSITVNGNADPASTGRAVAREQGRAASDSLRNARGAVR